MDKHPIDVAAEAVGSQATLARLLSVSRGAVNQWKDAGRMVPLEHCATIERLASGRTTRRQLRPTDWHLIWPELVTKDHPAPEAPAQASTGA